MQVKALNDQFMVSSQITVEDVAWVKEQGFSCVICNRPDGEEQDQPLWADIKAALEDQDIKAVFMPVASREQVLGAAQEIRACLEKTTGPVFAYCRTGTRCEMLWNLSQSAS